MFELGMNPDNIREDCLTYEQKCIVGLFKELMTSGSSLFSLKNDFTKDEVDDAIKQTIADALRDKEKDCSDINIDNVVVHGIHQFTPIMLKTIEILSKYKNVIVLFNYQPDYKNVYQTWLNIYSWFESKINLSNQNFNNDSQEFEGGIVADNMAAMIAGSTAAIDLSKRIEVTEFDNQTEFAGYVAKKFENASHKRENDEFRHPALYYMDEQIYAVNSGVNQILKIYFPEQFGEREFLDYPIGHFFISVTNMWDPESNVMCLIYVSYWYGMTKTLVNAMAFIPLSWKDGVLEKVLLIAQDTTQEKLAEIESRIALKEAYEAANKANRSKTEFLSNMSHDIRTPMNAIVGMTAIAGANIDHPDRVIDCLGKITKSSRHLLGLINEVLDMSRIENGKIELTEEDFNLAELVDNLLAMTRSEIDAHHHNFEVQLNKIEHEYVRGDSLRVQQIFTNIMSNAIKYTPDGGNILFSITEKPTTSLDIGCYEFVIQDNGMGMSEEFQKVMFDPFTRADDKRISEIQGTGLGMAITRNIVNMMNGNIKVESKLGKGSRFTVTIFLRLRDEKSETIDELVNLPVLVVDDDKTCCEGTVAILNEIGIDGEWVLSGKEAVERAVKRHENGNDYFVYIIDWQMPGMDGIETTRQIRQKIGPDVSVIVLTSYDYTKIEEEAKAAGVDEFISKPLFRSRLTAALQNIISGKPSQDARNYLKNIAASDYTGKKILLVEDNELNREVAAEIIGMTGAEIETAVNGKEAVDKVADHPNGYYDLVFMDVQMPIMNGYEAATAIRSLPKHKGDMLPIIAMTANAFTEDVILAKSAGMNEHIAKPLDMEKLNRMLHEWM